MAFQFDGAHALEQQVDRVLERLSRGEPPRLIETAQAAVGEEPRRRQRRPKILPGGTSSDEAARPLGAPS